MTTSYLLSYIAALIDRHALPAWSVGVHDPYISVSAQSHDDVEAWAVALGQPAVIHGAQPADSGGWFRAHTTETPYDADVSIRVQFSEDIPAPAAVSA